MHFPLSVFPLITLRNPAWGHREEKEVDVEKKHNSYGRLKRNHERHLRRYAAEPGKLVGG